MNDSFLADSALEQFFSWGRENLSLEELLRGLFMFSILNHANRTRVKRFLHADNCLRARAVFSELLTAAAAQSVHYMEQLVSSATWLTAEQEREPPFGLFCSLGRYRFIVGLNVSPDQEMRGRRVELFVTSVADTLFTVAYNDDLSYFIPKGVRVLHGQQWGRTEGTVRLVESEVTRHGNIYKRGDTLLFDQELNEYHEGPGVYDRAVTKIRELEEQLRVQFRSLVLSMLPFSADIQFGCLRVAYRSNDRIGFEGEITTSERCVRAWAAFLRSLSRTA